MSGEKLAVYIKKGLDRGFKPAYIKEVLTRHGYSGPEIESAFNYITASSEANKQATSNDNNLHKKLVIGLAILVFIAVSMGVVYYTVSDSNTPTGAVVQDTRIQSYMDKIGALSSKIDEREGLIESQLNELRRLEYDARQTERMINNIDALYNQIKEERKEVKLMLLELLDQIIVRG